MGPNETVRCPLSREQILRDLRSPLLICAAVLFTAAALAAAPGLKQVFTAEGRDAFYLQLLIGDIDPAAWAEWFVLYGFVYTVGFLGPLLLCIGLWITLFTAARRPAAGPGFFRVLAWVYHVFSWAAALSLGGLFLLRVTLYVLKEAPRTGGFLFISAMLLPELVFAALAAIVVITAVRWTKKALHTAENLRYNVLSEQCRSYSMHGAAAAAFFLTGVFALAIALLHWGQHLPMAAFGLTFAGDLLAGIWLQRYRRITDRRIFAARRMAEGKPVSFKL